MKRDLYATVTTRIVAELEQGAARWTKSWSATPGANTPCNAVSNRPYSGCNVVLLWMSIMAVSAAFTSSRNTKLCREQRAAPGDGDAPLRLD